MSVSMNKAAIQAGESSRANKKKVGSVAFGAPAPVCSNVLVKGIASQLTPEEMILNASCAFDALARRAVMDNRSKLTKTQTDILMHLALFGPSSMSVLSKNLAVSKEHISRAVTSLCGEGLVQKQRSSGNFRVVEAVLTKKGRELADSIRQDSIERLRDPLEALEPEEKEELIRLSARATQLLCKLNLQ